MSSGITSLPSKETREHYNSIFSCIRCGAEAGDTTQNRKDPKCLSCDRPYLVLMPKCSSCGEGVLAHQTVDNDWGEAKCPTTHFVNETRYERLTPLDGSPLDGCTLDGCP